MTILPCNQNIHHIKFWHMTRWNFVWLKKKIVSLTNGSVGIRWYNKHNIDGFLSFPSARDTIMNHMITWKTLLSFMTSQKGMQLDPELRKSSVDVNTILTIWAYNPAEIIIHFHRLLILVTYRFQRLYKPCHTRCLRLQNSCHMTYS